MIELENRLTLIGSKRFVIAPRAPADLIAVARLSLKPGGLREDSIDVPGQDGLTRTVLGYADAEITVEIQIWDEAQLQNVRRLADLFRPRREQKTFQPLQIVAPAATRWGVKNVYIFEVREGAWTAQDGMTLTLQMREWQSRERRKTKTTKPVGGGAAAGAAATGSNDYSFLEGRDIAAPSKGGAPKP